MARMGEGRAPPGPVAQQRSTERGVAAPLPMPDEGRTCGGTAPRRGCESRRPGQSFTTHALERVDASRLSISDLQIPR
jgi:hypothetical protein